MKKIKDMLRRIGTVGLAAIMLTAQMPVIASAEEIAQPQEIVVSDEAIPAKVQMEDVLPIETYGDTATAETDGFSLYTVEFTYDNKQYVLPGDSEVALSEILDTVGLTGEVSAVEVSDESLFSAKKCKTANGSTPEKDEDGNVIEDENGTWFVFAHQAFSTEEWMKVTIGGVVYEITVTDDTTEITAWDELKTALSAGVEVKLTQNIIAGETDTHLLVPKGTTATLDLNGHTIDYSASNEAQIVDGNGAEGGLNISRNGAIVVLGTLTIKDSGTGGTITGGTGDKASLAAYGNVTMQGGKLIGRVYLGDEENQGYGGITMTGGTIDGHMFIDSKSSFSMQDGCTVENTCITCNGTFTMTGGSISSHNVSQVVFVGGTFTMSGGTISGTEVGNSVVEVNSRFIMTGGEVSGTGKQGGIFPLAPLSFHISGTPKISSVYLASNALVNIDGPLTSGASIPVISSQKPTADTPVVITSGLAKGGENAESFFTNKTDGTTMVKNSSGELELQREATEWDTLQASLSQGGTVTLTKDYTATSVDQRLTIPKSTQVTIDLNGHKIDGSKLTTEYVFYIEAAPVNTPYSTLTITDSGNGGEILCGNNGAVELGGGGFLTFNMQGGTITSSGYSIISTRSSGSFNMSGGTINGKITDSDTPVPGSVVSMGVDNFHMTGGTISGTGYENVVFFSNAGRAFSSYISGGVISGTNVTNVVNLMLNSDFTASGGTIDGSRATNAVCVSQLADLSTLRFAVSGSPTIKGPVMLTCDTGSLPVTVAGRTNLQNVRFSPEGNITAKIKDGYTNCTLKKNEEEITASGDGTYTIPVTAEAMDITADMTAPLTHSDISFDASAQTYKGEELAIPVMHLGRLLTRDTDYTVTYTKDGKTVEKLQDAGNYTATFSGKGYYSGEKAINITIDKAPLTVTAKDHSITYGDAPSGGGVTYSGLVNGEKESALGGELDYDFDYSQYGNVGSYTITPKGLTSGNYDISFRSGTLTVGKKDIRVSGIRAQDKVYDGKPDAELDYTNAVLGGVVNNDELMVTASGAFADANAGENKMVNISNLALGGAAVGNYKLAESGQQTTATAEISNADIPTGQITAPTAKSGLIYTGSAQQLIEAGNVAGSIGTMYYAVTSTDTAPADNLYTTSIPAKTDAGTYYVWYKVIGDANHNDRTPAHIEVSIGKAAHSPQTANGSAKYGASGTVDLSALIEEDGTVGTITKTDNDSVLNGEPTVTEGKLNFAFADTENNAGKTAAVTIPITSANYADYSITVTLTVKAKEVPVLTVDPITKTYDGTAVTGAQIRGTAKVNGTEIKGTWKFEYGASFVDAADSGAKKVIFTPEDTATYDTAEAMLALTINKAVITIKAADKSIYVGDTVPSLYNLASGNDYTVTGLVGSDQLATAPTLSYSAAPDNTKAGSYTITPGGAAVPASGNYADAISYQTGTLTIKAKSGGGSTDGGNTGGGGSSGGGGSTDGGNSGGGSPAPVTPSENYTVPVSGENTVEVTAEITNGNAVINEISKSDIDRMIDSGSGSKSGEESIPITIDLSQAKSEVYSVELSGKTMERLTEAVNAENNVESVEIKLTNATVTLDGAALSAVNEQAEGRSVTLAVEDTNTGDLNKAQQSSLKQFDSVRPFRAAFESDGKEIHDFKGGSVRVSLSFSPEKDRNARHYHIYYLPKAGAMKRLLTYYTKGLLSFVTSHFSDYAIVYDQSIENGDPEDPVNPEDPVELIEMHRLYNPNSGEHFYTGNVEEKDHLVELGWNYEGVAWNAPEKSEIPVYRLYNPNAGDHHYTTDVKERDFLIKVGWNDEGIGWYSEESETVALFRLYNPNALGAGAHHFTADAAERDHLIEIGWRDEKTGWYGALRMAAVHFK